MAFKKKLGREREKLFLTEEIDKLAEMWKMELS